MTDRELELRQRINDGLKIREVLDNPVFQRVVDSLRREHFDSWTTSKEIYTRENIFHQTKALDAILSRLSLTVAAGEEAAAELRGDDQWQ